MMSRGRSGVNVWQLTTRIGAALVAVLIAVLGYVALDYLTTDAGEPTLIDLFIYGFISSYFVVGVACALCIAFRISTRPTNFACAAFLVFSIFLFLVLLVGRVIGGDSLFAPELAILAYSVVVFGFHLWLNPIDGSPPPRIGEPKRLGEIPRT